MVIKVKVSMSESEAKGVDIGSYTSFLRWQIVDLDEYSQQWIVKINISATISRRILVKQSNN